MADATLNTFVDNRAATLNREREQRRRVLLEAATMPQNDTLVLVLDNTSSAEMDAAEAALPITGVTMYTHDGGVDNGVDDTWAISAGDTFIFEFWDPDNVDNKQGSAEDLSVTEVFTEVTHAISGGTDTAYTATQLAASLNADPNFTKWAYAGAELTADRVTIFPKGPRGKLRVTGGTAQAVVLFPGGDTDNSQRTFTMEHQIVADWTWTYDAGTKTLTITQANVTAPDKVTAVVDLY